ncbi:MAG: GTPase Era [Prevotellaceae bacterium]|jgi:GTP-binding protein Era|nr:GTPase Era [Prevotellaceae bacterium]
MRTDLQLANKPHRSGFVNIIGNPNVGKSTLMNELVGENLSIITAKSQTTRHRILGIVSGKDFQIVYSDTPGIIKPKYRLQSSMMKFVNAAIGDADVIVYVTDVVEKLDKNIEYIERLNNIEIPIILVINKIDLANQQILNDLVEQWQKLLPKALIYPASALKKFNLDNIFSKILELIPEGAAYYAKDELTDKNLRFFASEIIREKILLCYQKEIPYCVEVDIENFIEKKNMYSIDAVIYVARESQKGIIIGQGGKSLKRTGTAARKDMEKFFDKKVFLKLFVKVDPDWRDSEQQLKRFGYIQD